MSQLPKPVAQASTAFDGGQRSEFRILSAEELPNWDALVVQHPHGSIYHTSYWKAAIEEGFPHMRGEVLACRDPGSHRLLAGLPLYLVRSWLLGNRMVSVPFGAYCDPLTPDDRVLKELLDAAIAEVGKEHFASLEFRPWRLATALAGLGVPTADIFLHHCVSLDRPLETISKGCSRTCVRQWIHRAEKHGVTVRPAEGETELDALYALVSETRRAHAVPVIPRKFFVALRRHVPWMHSEWLLGFLDGKPVSAALALKCGDVYTLEYAGHSAVGKATGASALVYWEALTRAHREGYAWFSFARTSTRNAPLCEYKRRWGAQEIELPVYVVPRVSRPHPRVWRRHGLYLVARSLLRHVPRSVQDWIGSFCYRHWG